MTENGDRHISRFVTRLLADASPVELMEAQENLDELMGVFLRIYARLERDGYFARARDKSETDASVGGPQSPGV